jgi:hypothetical protein
MEYACDLTVFTERDICAVRVRNTRSRAEIRRQELRLHILRRAEELASGNFPLIWVRRCGAGQVIRAARRAAPVQSVGIAASRPGPGCRISLRLRKHCHSTSLVIER